MLKWGLVRKLYQKDYFNYIGSIKKDNVEVNDDIAHHIREACRNEGMFTDLMRQGLKKILAGSG